MDRSFLITNLRISGYRVLQKDKVYDEDEYLGNIGEDANGTTPRLQSIISKIKQHGKHRWDKNNLPKIGKAEHKIV